MREQVSYFERSLDYMVRMFGENGTEEMLKKAMFTITMIYLITYNHIYLSSLKTSSPFIHLKVVNIVLYVDA